MIFPGQVIQHLEGLSTVIRVIHDDPFPVGKGLFLEGPEWPMDFFSGFIGGGKDGHKGFIIRSMAIE
jgi:hypothetical protein